MVGIFPPGLATAGGALAQAIPEGMTVPPPPIAGPTGGASTDAGIDVGSGAPARDRSRDRPCKCPPEKGAMVQKNHTMNPEPRRYQARITGFDYYIVTDGKGKETSKGWNMEWAWQPDGELKPVNFDGFVKAQCLLQEAKGNYDQFLNEQNMPIFPFQGFKEMMDTIQKHGRIVHANPPTKLMWYFETPRTRSLMMPTLRSANVPSIFQP